MSLFGQMFNKKKELKGEEIASLLSSLSVHREPVIVKTENFKFVTDILSYDSRVFHLKNTLTRDEVLYQLKGRDLRVLIPYELTLYGGDSRLLGLGLSAGVHSLKLSAPDLLSQQESRGAYRVSRFPEQPTVTFTTDHTDIIKCRLADISMTGAGLRLDPRWERGNTKLTPRTTMIVDIRINQDLRLSTTAVVRYSKGYKCGIQFAELGKGTRDKLFRFVVDQRREEQRAMIRIQERTPEPAPTPAEQAPLPEEKTSGRPTVLVVGDRPADQDFFHALLSRKYDVLFAAPTIPDIRAHLELRPNMCLIGLQEENQEQVVQLRKASTLLHPGCVLMFFGHGFSEGFQQRFAGYGYPEDILIDLHEAKKLLVFKHIDGYFTRRAPR